VTHAAAAPLKLFAGRVRGFERLHHSFRAYRKRLIVDRFANRCTAARDLLESIWFRVAHADVGKRERQANAGREQEHFLNGVMRLGFEHQLRQNAEGHLRSGVGKAMDAVREIVNSEKE